MNSIKKFILLNGSVPTIFLLIWIMHINYQISIMYLIISFWIAVIGYVVSESLLHKVDVLKLFVWVIIISAVPSFFISLFTSNLFLIYAPQSFFIGVFIQKLFYEFQNK